MATLDDFSKEDLTLYLAGVATNLLKDERAVDLAKSSTDINRVWLSVYHSMKVGIERFDADTMKALSQTTIIMETTLQEMINAESGSVQQ